MKRTSLSLTALTLSVFLSLLLAGCDNPLDAAHMKYVDVNAILEKSRAAREADAHLEKARAALQKGYDDLVADQKDQPDAERRQTLAQGKAVLQRQLAVEQEAARRIVLDALGQAAEAWGKDNPDLWLVTRATALSAPDSADVTPDILARMEKLEVTFPDLPKVTIRGDASPTPTEKKTDPTKPTTGKAPAQP